MEVIQSLVISKMENKFLSPTAIIVLNFLNILDFRNCNSSSKNPQRGSTKYSYALFALKSLCKLPSFAFHAIAERDKYVTINSYML